jgi:hypothetical protein
MTLRLQPTSLAFLNPVLAPLSNIIITSGAIDSLHLRAVGREYLALGEMKMYYKNLKIKLIKDGNEENTTFVTKAISFLANEEGLRRAVDYFSFSNGLIKIKDVIAQLYNVRYTGSNLIHADRLSVTSSANKVKAEVSDVFIDDMLLDDKAENVVVDGIRWRKANVSLKSSAGTKAKTSNAGSFNIKNIAGKNTQLSFSNGKADINTFIQSLSISSITKNGEESPKVEGLLLAGNNLGVKNGPLKLSATNYNISSATSSFFVGFKNGAHTEWRFIEHTITTNKFFSRYKCYAGKGHSFYECAGTISYHKI